MSSFEVFLSPPHLAGSEEALIRQALASNYVAPAGPLLERFERDFSEYIDCPCLAVSSGTAALHLAMRYLGVGPGDEVWAATLTFIGSIAPAVYQGAEPVFLDCEAASWTLDPELLSEALRTAARDDPRNWRRYRSPAVDACGARRSHGGRSFSYPRSIDRDEL